MNLYRATFERADGTLRKMTFADGDAGQAQRTAAQWQAGDKLVQVELDRELRMPRKQEQRALF